MKVKGDVVSWRGNRFSLAEFCRLTEAAGDDVVWRHIGQQLELWAPGQPGVVNKSSSTCLKLFWDEVRSKRYAVVADSDSEDGKHDDKSMADDEESDESE